MNQNKVPFSLNKLLNTYKIWKFLEIKVCLLHYSNDSKWIPLFIHLQFLEKRVPIKN